MPKQASSKNESTTGYVSTDCYTALCMLSLGMVTLQNVFDSGEFWLKRKIYKMFTEDHKENPGTLVL